MNVSFFFPFTVPICRMAKDVERERQLSFQLFIIDTLPNLAF
jgi:hypothetical protein